MKVRNLLFLLFLYVLLVWIVAFYLGKDVVDRGLIGTAIGIALLLLWLIGERLFTWWAERRERRANMPKSTPTGKNVLSDEDRAFGALLREAEHKLASKMGESGSAVLADYPVYVILGPEGAGKTSVIRNSGLDPRLLAGQAAGADGKAPPTQVANIWLANKSVLLEIGGSIVDGDPARLSRFVSILKGSSQAWTWKSLLGTRNATVQIRGIVLVFDGSRFQGTPELDRVSQQWRDRLQRICGAAGMACPVYVMFTRMDAILYFPDFITGLSETERQQAFGIVKPLAKEQTESAVWADSETKLLSRLFNTLFLGLSNRRRTALAREMNPSKRPAIYEFPREFKRLRTSTVQFLVDVFKPDPLLLSPRLRGFFFTGTVKSERRTDSAEGDATQSNVHGGLQTEGATRIFQPETMQAFLSNNPSGVLHDPTGSNLIDRWLFVSEFFSRILPNDRSPTLLANSAPSSTSLHTKLLAFAAVLAGVALLVWTVSWFGNRELISRVEGTAVELHRASHDPSPENLEALERTRKEIARLEEGSKWSLHWGLYAGDDLLPLAKAAYFERLRQIALNDLNQSLASGLRQPLEKSGYDAVYKKLKTHVTITAKACKVDPKEIVAVLDEQVPEVFRSLNDTQKALLHHQFNYYAAELEKRMPVQLPQDSTAVTKAQTFLNDASGIDQVLRGILAEIAHKVPDIRVEDVVPGLHAVLNGPSVIAGTFSRNGATEFESLVEKGGSGEGTEECVTGKPSNTVTNRMQGHEKAAKLRTAYYRQYADRWKATLSEFSVKPYGGLSAAVQHLDSLSSPQSPLLTVVKLISRNCNFPAAKPGIAETIVKAPSLGRFGRFLKRDEVTQAGKKLATSLEANAEFTAADVWSLFQPARYTATPESDQFVEKNSEAYIMGLRGLKKTLNDLALASGDEKDSMIAPARNALDQASSSHAALADNFADVNNEGVNRMLAELLRQPIQLAERDIPRKGEELPALLKSFCSESRSVFSKFPFDAKAAQEATLSDFQWLFAPGTGKVWTFRLKALGTLTEFRDQRWQQKGDAPKPVVSSAVLNLLNRAQQLMDAFYPAGATRPNLQYSLRPSNSGPAIRLLIDGTEMNSKDSGIRKTFTWPAKEGVRSSAEGYLVSNEDEAGFGRYGGLWAVFRLFYDADSREIGYKSVRWSKSRGQGPGAEPQALKRPVAVDIVDLPGGVDLFNPQFFSVLRCPGKGLE